MTINTHNNYEYDDNKYQHIALYILQIITICNAIKDGWVIKKLDNKTYEFTKNNFNYDDFDLKAFIHKITSF
jgi:hypothetical protein